MHHPPLIPTSANVDPQQYRPCSSSNSIGGANMQSRSIQDTIEGWIDFLASPLSSSMERIEALNSIELCLCRFSSAASPSPRLVGIDTSKTFWALQTVAGYNLAQTLLSHLYRLHLDLCREDDTFAEAFDQNTPLPSERGISEQQKQRLQQCVSEICISMTILQGLALCSSPTKKILQRKSSLELLLQIVLSEYCVRLLPPILVPNPTPPSTPVTPSFPSSTQASTLSSSSSSRSKNRILSDESSKQQEAHLSLPSGFALDLLMCILVDSDIAQERFSDMGGMTQIVQLSHKCADMVTSVRFSTGGMDEKLGSASRCSVEKGTVLALKQTDLLCLEFRYFWAQMLKSASSNQLSSRSPSPLLEWAEQAQVPDSAATSFHTAGLNTPTQSQPGTPKAYRMRAARGSTPEAAAIAATPKAPRRRVTAPLASGSPVKPEKDVDTASYRRNGSIGEALGPEPAPHAVAAAAATPRRLRQSTSVVELRRRVTTADVTASASKSSSLRRLEHDSKLPARSFPTPTSRTERRRSPTADNAASGAIRSEDLRAGSASRFDASNPSSSQASQGHRERQRRSTDSEIGIDANVDTVGTSALGHMNEAAANRYPVLHRPGMSSRDRPRIPSPLKPRSSETSATSSSSSNTASQIHRTSLDAVSRTSGGMPYRRLRSSTTTSPFLLSSSPLAEARESSEDSENHDPYRINGGLNRHRSSSPLAKTVEEKDDISSVPVQHDGLVRSRHRDSAITSPLSSTDDNYARSCSPAPSSKPSADVDQLKYRIVRSQTTSGFTPSKKKFSNSSGVTLGMSEAITATSVPSLSSQADIRGIGGAGAGGNTAGKTNLSARIPPSPAVRRAQLARARSLSPTKFGAAILGDEERVPSVPSIPQHHLIQG